MRFFISCKDIIRKVNFPCEISNVKFQHNIYYCYSHSIVPIAFPTNRNLSLCLLTILHFLLVVQYHYHISTRVLLQQVFLDVMNWLFSQYFLLLSQNYLSSFLINPDKHNRHEIFRYYKLHIHRRAFIHLNIRLLKQRMEFVRFQCKRAYTKHSKSNTCN